MIAKSYMQYVFSFDSHLLAVDYVDFRLMLLIVFLMV